MQNLKSAKILTIVVMVISPLIVGLYDLIIYLRFGSDATISRILYYTASDYPIFAVGFGLALGILLGHLFVPQIIVRDESK